jgi:hypothetical protein
VTFKKDAHIVKCLSAVLIAAAALAVRAADFVPQSLTLRGEIVIGCAAESAAIDFAANDLATDFGKVLGKPARVSRGTNGVVAIRIDPTLMTPESWRIEIAPAGIVISAADNLGAIFGIYEFSEKLLGVDPLWFWKDMEPARKDELVLPSQTFSSQTAAFHYRGWFVNDEDLLTEWKPGSGKRDLDYPYYNDVISLEIADRIFEALLRSGGNLVIPASFVDVMNPPEASLLRRAVERGLYVTQHHIEPLGVSHFGFETYWKKRGEKTAFSYSSDPDRVRKTWTDYAKTWREIAGDQVIWQLGLRGRGDRPVWVSDKGVKADNAGEFVSRAFADEWKIIRNVDPRPVPPATTTLWSEGSDLMRKGALKIPPGVTVVFADEGRSQMMQDDFRETKREPGRDYGAYYHLAFWIEGPHLVQGTRPEKMKRNFDALISKGDTNYAIINVSNVREHVLGISAAMEIMRRGSAWDENDFLSRWSPPEVQNLYREFHASFVELSGDRLLQDGTCYILAKQMLDVLEKGKRYSSPAFSPANGTLPDALASSIARLDGVIRNYSSSQIPAARRGLYDFNLRAQAAMLRHFYACLRELSLAFDDRAHLSPACAEMDELLKSRETCATGRWAGWYRGDKKENLPALLQRMQDLAAAAKDRPAGGKFQ